MTDTPNFDELNYIEQRVRDEAPNIFIAYAIWFFLGWLGIHRMFLGRGGGVIMLILCIVSLVTMVIIIGSFGAAIVTIWWLIDALLIPGWINQKKDALRVKIKAEM